MPKNKSVEFMLTFVQDYLDGETERCFFDMDFDHYFIQHYPSMERFNSSLAECFAFYLSEEGIDRSESLSDGEHKRLIRRQYKKFLAAMKDGFY